MVQVRWFCRTCLREWLQHSAAGAAPWSPDHGCPGCRGSQIDQVQYQAPFPGGDIPRTSSPQVAAAVEEREQEIARSTPLALAQE